jgi:hypothetical protein
VLTTTLIHHQHYFPVEGGDGKLKNAFLAVINTEPDNERTIARNAERVVTARLRDARFFWEADRRATLESRIDRLGTLLFHKKLGTYKEKAERIERLAGWIAREALGADAAAADHAARAARLAKADLTTDMVREFTELQGTMGGIYAREEGMPEEVWKAIYFHYLPVGVEADAPPSKAQLGKAAVTWAAVSLADKLDTIVGLFAAGEKPTGSARSGAAPCGPERREDPRGSAGRSRWGSSAGVRRVQPPGRECRLEPACFRIPQEAPHTCSSGAASKPTKFVAIGALVPWSADSGSKPCRMRARRKTSKLSPCCSNASRTSRRISTPRSPMI